MKTVSLLFFSLIGKIDILFPRVHIGNNSPAGRDLV